MLINITRWLGVIMGVVIAIYTTALLPLTFFKEVTDLLHEHLPTNTFTLETPDLLKSIDFFGVSLPNNLINLSLPAQVSMMWVLEMAVYPLLPLFFIVLLIHIFTPLQSRIYSAFGTTAIPVHPESEINHHVRSLVKINKGPRAYAYVLPLSTVVAYAMHSPIKGGVILISQGALEHLDEKEINWVIAHEYGHIINRDCNSATFWILSQRGVRMFDCIRHKLSNILLRIISIIPIIRIFTFPVHVVISVISFFGRLGQKFGAMIHLILDRFSGRAAELRADEFAAKMEGAAAGISVFQKMQSDIEPVFGGIFATHPPLMKRIDLLSQMK